MKSKFNKVVLAYSGGLDTSVIVPWLKVKALIDRENGALAALEAPDYSPFKRD